MPNSESKLMQDIEAGVPAEPAVERDPVGEVGANEVDILGLLIVLAKRKALILKVTATLAIIAVVVSLVIPNHYTATTMIMPPQQTQSTATMLMSQLAGSSLGSLASLAGGASALGLKNPNDIYIGMLKSRSVEDAIIQQFGFQHIYKDKKLSDTRKDLESYTDVTSGKDSLISVSFEDKDPARAAAVANAYCSRIKKADATSCSYRGFAAKAFFRTASAAS